jgi:hypothetical protein
MPQVVKTISHFRLAKTMSCSSQWRIWSARASAKVTWNEKMAKLDATRDVRYVTWSDLLKMNTIDVVRALLRLGFEIDTSLHIMTHE